MDGSKITLFGLKRYPSVHRSFASVGLGAVRLSGYRFFDLLDCQSAGVAMLAQIPLFLSQALAFHACTLCLGTRPISFGLLGLFPCSVVLYRQRRCRRFVAAWMLLITNG